MLPTTMPDAGPASNQSGALSRDAEQWGAQLAAAGLPRRYILRLYAFVRVAADGARFEHIAQEARRAILQFDVVQSFGGMLGGSKGDRFEVDPLNSTRAIVLWRETSEGWREVTAFPPRCTALPGLPPIFDALPMLERNGFIRYRRCVRPTVAALRA